MPFGHFAWTSNSLRYQVCAVEQRRAGHGIDRAVRKIVEVVLIRALDAELDAGRRVVFGGHAEQVRFLRGLGGRAGLQCGVLASVLRSFATSPLETPPPRLPHALRMYVVSAATSASSSLALNAGIMSPLGLALVAGERAPSRITAISRSGFAACTAELLRSGGNALRRPVPLSMWQPAQSSTYSAAPACMVSLSGVPGVSGSGPSSDFRYVAIASRSLCFRCCVDACTTSAIGPAAVAKRFEPVARYSTMSCFVQLPRPSCSPAPRFGANTCSAMPPCILPPVGPPSMFLDVWQAPQWPRLSTRYLPRFHSSG